MKPDGAYWPAMKMRKVRWALVAGLLGLATLATSACSAGTNAVDQTAGTQFRYTNATPQGQVIPPADRKKPGNVTGELLDGNGTYTLANDLGKVVVVNLWGAWCPPCRVETPQFQQVYLEMRADGVNFVGFDVKDGKQDAQAFVADNQITYPIVYDFPTKVALELGKVPVAGLPLTALIDKQGRVAAIYISIVQPSRLRPAIEGLLSET